ncbi:MAG: CPBP family glutamic-type intramembrane protease [Planctomycetota bacterium]|jgi:hypothetical protein
MSGALKSNSLRPYYCGRCINGEYAKTSCACGVPITSYRGYPRFRATAKGRGPLETTTEKGPARDLLALILLVPVPTIGTAAGLLIAFPLFWLLAVEKGRLSWSPPRKGGFGAGAILGAAIAVVIAGAYFVLGRTWIDADSVKTLAAGSGLTRKALYIPFVFTRCLALARRLGVTKWAAVGASALFFTFHHVVAVRALFDWRVTALACTGVFIGGAVWSALYERYQSIWPAYLSHLIADIPIFVIGWSLIFQN